MKRVRIVLFVTLFINQGLKSSLEPVDAQQMLLEGAKEGNIDKMQEALKNGADINRQELREDRDHKIQTTALHEALISHGWNNIETYHQGIKLLLDNGADANQNYTMTDKNYPLVGVHAMSPLNHYLVVGGSEKDPEVVKMLLKKGADPNATAVVFDERLKEINPLAISGNKYVTKVLLEHGANRYDYKKVYEINRSRIGPKLQPVQDPSLEKYWNVRRNEDAHKNLLKSYRAVDHTKIYPEDHEAAFNELSGQSPVQEAISQAKVKFANLQGKFSKDVATSDPKFQEFIENDPQYQNALGFFKPDEVTFEEFLKQNPKFAKNIKEEKEWFKNVRKEFAKYALSEKNSLAQLLFKQDPNKDWTGAVIKFLDPEYGPEFLMEVAGNNREYQERALEIIKAMKWYDPSLSEKQLAKYSLKQYQKFVPKGKSRGAMMSTALGKGFK